VALPAGLSSAPLGKRALFKAGISRRKNFGLRAFADGLAGGGDVVVDAGEEIGHSTFYSWPLANLAALGDCTGASPEHAARSLTTAQVSVGHFR